jgi:LPS O-antigen subunit length determinant protein (WzzB/FepE family)
MSIILVMALGIAVLLILLFFAMNKWSSIARDREKSAELRKNRQMTPTGTEGRGTGIN